MSGSAPPLIGITCGNSRSPLRLQHLYGEAIRRAGGSPRYLHAGHCQPSVDTLNGLLIPGGRDIRPERYGETMTAALDPEDDDRTSLELLLLDAFLKYNKPVFGICYGMQLLNIHLGGSLHKDIGAAFPQAFDHTAGLHEIAVSKNPSIPEGTWLVNSSHHQAVRRLAAGLVPAAFSADGMLEAFSADRAGFLLGVQWHPERLCDRLSDLLFRRFVAACQVL